MGTSGPFQGETDLSDWKTFDGFSLPTKHVNKQNGQSSSVVVFTEIHFNPEIDPKLFEKPAGGTAAQ
jgi:hypothetical protein